MQRRNIPLAATLIVTIPIFLFLLINLILFENTTMDNIERYYEDGEYLKAYGYCMQLEREIGNTWFYNETCIKIRMILISEEYDNPESIDNV